MLAMGDCPFATMTTVSQGCFLSRHHGALPGVKKISSSSRFRSKSARVVQSRDVQENHVCVSHRGVRIGGCGGDGSAGDEDAEKWLGTGIGFVGRGLRYRPWTSSAQVVLQSPAAGFDAESLSGIFSGLRTTITEGVISSFCWKWVLAMAISVSVNFLPWATDIAFAQRASPAECNNVSQYYSQASGLEGEKLKAKLHEIVAGHKRLSYAEVWNALKILDAADTETPDTSPDIVDIYSLKRLAKSLQGKSEGWNREHLWPRSYGLDEGRPEFTDVHNLRPADVNVNSSRGNKYFGDCTALMTPRCLIPANREAAADTATDADSWRPPSQVRGDIARAVLYMAIRYGSEQPSGSLNLQLSDSPAVAKATMGLLSTLLQWNNLDPPSPAEVQRNSRVCSLYQGNRNPFVDHPEYASIIWGAPEVITGPTSPTGSEPENETQLSMAWVNEIHYTNKGQDQNEFIEVVVGPETDISSLKIYLYDNKGTVYRELPLADATLFRASKINGSKPVIYSADLPGGSIQNGPRDGIALVQDNSKVLQFLSYQGVVTAVDGPANGLISKDIGVREGENSPLGGSIGLSGAGRRYEDFKWMEFSGGASPGSVNTGQLIS